MSDDFKRKLEAYEKGELSREEIEEFEQELEKFKHYQVMNEQNVDNKKGKSPNEIKKEIGTKRPKWKKRFKTVISAGALFLVFTILSTIITTIYYSWGSPDRVDVFRKVIDYTLTITEPYGHLGGTSTNAKPFFRLEATRDLRKRVGSETIKVGDLKVNYLFSMMAYPVRQYYGEQSQNKAAFTFPGAGPRNMSSWETLREIPEGTVASAYLSFTELKTTDEVFSLFDGRNVELSWFAVYTGTEDDDFRGGIIFEPIGFPNFPIWHDDDMIVDSPQEEKGPFGMKMVSQGSMSPGYQNGDYEVLHQQFLKTIHFLKNYERHANQLYFGQLNLSERVDFLEDYGITHYGVVLTGPSKEMLALQEEDWVSELEVDEIRFWNWNQ